MSLEPDQISAILHGIALFALAVSVPIVLFLGLKNRNLGEGKGIGWSFLRFVVIAISLPIVGMLSLNGALTGEAATLIAGAMGYAFGKSEESQ